MALTIAAIIVLLVASLAILLSSDRVQNWVAQTVMSTVSENLDADFSVGSISLNIFGKISVDSLSVADRSGSEALFVNHIFAHIKPLPLLKGEIVVSRVEVDSLAAHLRTDTAGILNIQFLIDAFTPETPAGKVPALLFPVIEIRNSTIRYTNRYKYSGGENQSSYAIDYNNILLSQTNADIALSFFDGTTDIAVKNLNFKEKSGLNVTDFTTNVIITDSTFFMPKLVLTMPQSRLNLDSITAKFYKSDGKIDFGKTEFNFSIPRSEIILSDFKHFVPEFARLKKPLIIDTHIFGQLNNFKATNLMAQYGDVLSLKSNIRATGLPDIKEAYFKYNIENAQFDRASVQDLVAKIIGRPFVLPAEMDNLGVCRYSGKINGSLSDMIVNGTLKTAIGNIISDASLQVTDSLRNMKLNGKIASKRLNLAGILPDSGLGDISFSSVTNLEVGKDKPFNDNTSLKINYITYKDYTYQNIYINGNITPDCFAGKIEADDPNGYLYFDGMLSNINGYRTVECNASVKHLNLYNLNLVNENPDLDINLNLITNFEGNKWETMDGMLLIDSLYLKNGQRDFLMEKFLLTAENKERTAATVESDIINGGLSGEYSLIALYDNILMLASEHMPVLKSITNVPKKWKRNNLSFSFDIEPLKPLFSTLNIPWYTTDASTIYGHLNTDKEDVDVRADIPRFTNGKLMIDNIALVANNDNGLNFSAAASAKMNKSAIDIGVDLFADDNKITAITHWDNNQSQRQIAGEMLVNAGLSFDNETGSLVADVNMLPTEFVLGDRLWSFNNGTVFYDGQRTIIENIGVKSDDSQSLHIDGIVSSNIEDEITVGLKDISLDYISDFLPEETEISFGGIVSGFATVADIFRQPQITADVVSDRFVFDDTYFGSVIAGCSFDTENIGINFWGTVTDNDIKTARLDGKYYFVRDSLDILLDANGLNVNFIDYYIADIFGRVTGKAYGNAHIYGITKAKTVAVDVDAFADDASIEVSFLNNRFFFSDSIHIDKNVIDFGRIDIRDEHGNTGVLEGSLQHNYFKNFKFDLAVSVNEMQVLNTTKAQSESFYGTAYGSGKVNIRGDENNVNIVCKATTESGTRLYIPIDSYYASENSFITFIEHKEKSDEVSESPADEPATNVLLDIMVDVTPAAEAVIIIDSKTGDMLRASGSGNLRLTYDVNADDMKLYGGVTIDNGSYLFTFQNLLRKEFKIKEGSSILWSGDLVNATVDIDASHRLTADLAEVLDEAVLQNTGRTSVPVECLMNLSGSLTQPNIKFDLNLPNSEEELNRALHNVVSTDEQMNRQIIALLLLGKFIKSENTNTNAIISQNELFSVVSSTLSSQLNNWASQMFDNWGFGVNFRTTGEGEDRTNEYEFNFQYTPTSRIIINGNLGYRDEATAMSSNPIIGDIDFEYKLIQSGKLRAKAYTHTNDYREFKKGLTTQGIGLVYSESFNSLPELFKTWSDNIQKSKKERIKKREIRKRKKEEKRAAKEDKKQKATIDNPE